MSKLIITLLASLFVSAPPVFSLAKVAENTGEAIVTMHQTLAVHDKELTPEQLHKARVVRLGLIIASSMWIYDHQSPSDQEEIRQVTKGAMDGLRETERADTSTHL